MKELKKFEEIIPESNLLDEEMDALRGGADDIKPICDEGNITVQCQNGFNEDKPISGGK